MGMVVERCNVEEIIDMLKTVNIRFDKNDFLINV